MASVNELLGQLPIDDIAAQLGISPDEARNAAAGLVPALVSGMQANAQSPGGAASLEEALGQHANRLTSGSAGVDPADGEKIAQHVFGDNLDPVLQRLSGAQGLSSGILAKLLPLLAPLVLSWLAGKMGGGKAGGGASGGDGAGGGGGIGGWLSDILGGGGAQPEQPEQPQNPPSQAPWDQPHAQQAPDAPAGNAPAGNAPAEAPGPKHSPDAAPAGQEQSAPEQPQQGGVGSWISDMLGGLLGKGRQ